MRNVKFRAWNNKSGQIWPVDKMVWGDNGHCHPIREENYLIYSDDDKLMQSTGLHDVAGNEIFEGDLVQFTTFDAVDVVIYEPPAFKTRRQSLQGYECKVIGNIYENPELLAQGKLTRPETAGSPNQVLSGA